MKEDYISHQSAMSHDLLHGDSERKGDFIAEWWTKFHHILVMNNKALNVDTQQELNV
jgi:hypothetical protein